MQKDLFVWEKGKGLVKFETGVGPGPMEVAMAGDTSALWMDCKSADLNGEESGKWVCCFGIDV